MWYLTDFYDSDNNYHLFCAECFSQIPDWLMRWHDSFIPAIPECDGCERKRMGR